MIALAVSEVRDTAGSYVLAEVAGETVPARYKRTDVGVIPEDWAVRSLKSMADIQWGASPRPIDDPIWYDTASHVG